MYAQGMTNHERCSKHEEAQFHGTARIHFSARAGARHCIRRFRDEDQTHGHNGGMLSSAIGFSGVPGCGRAPHFHGENKVAPHVAWPRRGKKPRTARASEAATSGGLCGSAAPFCRFFFASRRPSAELHGDMFLFDSVKRSYVGRLGRHPGAQAATWSGGSCASSGR